MLRLGNLLRFLVLLLWMSIAECQPTLNSTGASPNPVAQSTTCPLKPMTALDTKNVKSISLSTQPIEKSGQIRDLQSIGYAFEGKAKQKLSFSTKEDVCIWIYTPNNTLLNGSDLPIDGKYTIQVGIPKGSMSFTLALSLNSPQDTALTESPKTSTPATTTERVSFASGSTGASIQGQLTKNQRKLYVLQCGAGQSMTLKIEQGDISIMAIAPNSETISAINPNKNQWRGTLHFDGDYTLEVSASNNSDYTINVEVF